MRQTHFDEMNIWLEGAINGLFEGAEGGDGGRVEEGLELHEENRAELAGGVDPVKSIVGTGPGEATGRATAGVGDGIEEEAKGELVAGLGVGVQAEVGGDGRVGGGECGDVQEADLIDGHEANSFGLQDGSRAEDELEELGVVGSGGVKAVSAVEGFCGWDGAAGVGPEEAVALAAAVRDEAGELRVGQEEACILHTQGCEDVALEVLFEVESADGFDEAAGPVEACAVGPTGAGVEAEREEAGGGGFGLTVFGQQGIPGGVGEAGGVSEEMAEGDFGLGGSEYVEGFEDGELGQFGEVVFDGFVEGELALFDELEGGDGGDGFGEGGDGEDGVEGDADEAGVEDFRGGGDDGGDGGDLELAEGVGDGEGLAEERGGEEGGGEGAAMHS